MQREMDQIKNPYSSSGLSLSDSNFLQATIPTKAFTFATPFPQQQQHPSNPQVVPSMNQQNHWQYSNPNQLPMNAPSRPQTEQSFQPQQNMQGIPQASFQQQLLPNQALSLPVQQPPPQQIAFNGFSRHSNNNDQQTLNPRFATAGAIGGMNSFNQIAGIPNINNQLQQEILTPEQLIEQKKQELLKLEQQLQLQKQQQQLYQNPMQLQQQQQDGSQNFQQFQQQYNQPSINFQQVQLQQPYRFQDISQQQQNSPFQPPNIQQQQNPQFRTNLSFHQPQQSQQQYQIYQQQPQQWQQQQQQQMYQQQPQQQQFQQQPQQQQQQQLQQQLQQLQQQQSPQQQSYQMQQVIQPPFAQSNQKDEYYNNSNNNHLLTPSPPPLAQLARQSQSAPIWNESEASHGKQPVSPHSQSSYQRMQKENDSNNPFDDISPMNRKDDVSSVVEKNNPQRNLTPANQFKTAQATVAQKVVSDSSSSKKENEQKQQNQIFPQQQETNRQKSEEEEKAYLYQQGYGLPKWKKEPECLEQEQRVNFSFAGESQPEKQVDSSKKQISNNQQRDTRRIKEENKDELQSNSQKKQDKQSEFSPQNFTILKSMSDIFDLLNKQSDISSVVKVSKLILELHPKIRSLDQKKDFFRLLGDILQSEKLMQEIYKRKSVRSYPKNIDVIVKDIAAIFKIFLWEQSEAVDLEEPIDNLRAVCIDLIEDYDMFELIDVREALEEHYNFYQERFNQQRKPIREQPEFQTRRSGEIEPFEEQKANENPRQNQQNRRNQIKQNQQRPYQNEREEMNEKQRRRPPRSHSRRKVEISSKHQSNSRSKSPFQIPNSRSYKKEEFKKEYTIGVYPRINVTEIKANTSYTEELTNSLTDLKGQSSSNYLANHYFCLREDFNQRMRELLHPFCKSSNKVFVRQFSRDYRNEMNIYFNINITNFKFEKQQFVMHLKGYPLFTPKSYKFTDYNRLKLGQLIILADCTFKKIVMGTVCYVDEKINQTFKEHHQVQFGIVPCKKKSREMESILDFAIDFAKQSQKEGLYGFEPKGFWGSYSDCLEEMQRMADNKDHIPFNNLILNNIQQDNRSAAIYHEDMEYWDQYDSLNVSQKKAFQSMLTKTVCLISGSQESSKSKLISSFVEILLDNWSMWNPHNRPILVVAKKAETVNNFLIKLRQSQKGKYADQLLRLGNSCSVKELESCLISNEKLRKDHQGFLRSWRVVESQRKQTKEAFLKFVYPVLNLKDLLETDIMSFKISSTNILDKLIKDFLEILYLNSCPIESICKEDQILIFQRWWSCSINESMFSEIISKQMRVAGQTDGMQIYMEAYHNQCQDELKKFEKQNSKKKQTNYSTRFLQYETEAGYCRDEEIIPRNEEEGNYETKEIKPLEEVEFLNTREDFEDHKQLTFDLKSNNLFNLPFIQFAEIKQKLCMEKQKKLRKALIDSANIYSQASNSFTQDMLEVDLNMIKSKRIIGGTVTDAHKYIETLKKSEYYNLIVLDEAEQIIEGMLVPLLREGLQQLILFGNAEAQPTQLVNNITLERTYKYGQSLFQRLIKNNVSYEKLQLEQEPYQQERQQIQNQIKPNNPFLNPDSYGSKAINTLLESEELPPRTNTQQNRNKRGIPKPISHNPLGGNNSQKTKFSQFC